MRLLYFDFKLPYLIGDVSYPVGGYAVQLSSWFRGISSLDEPVDVGLLTFLGADEVAQGDRYCQIIETYDPDKGLKIAKYFYSYIPKLIATAREFKPTHIVQGCSGLHVGILAYVASKVGAKFIYRVANDFDADEGFKEYLNLYQSIAYQWGLKKSDAIICQNDYQMMHMRKRFPSKRLFKIQNPYESRAEELAEGNSELTPYVAWLGVFRHEKNLPLLVTIAEALPNVRFKVAGKFGGIENAEDNAAHDRLVELSNVDMVGYLLRAEIPEFLFHAKLLLNTSLYEGFSNTFLESFDMGTPVVCPQNVDPDLIIARNHLGESVADCAQLSEAVSRAFNMAGDEYARLSEHLKQYVLDNHDPVKLAKVLIQDLKDVS